MSCPVTPQPTGPPLGLSADELTEWHCADKRRRYDIELDAAESILLPGKLHRAALKFTPHLSATGRSGGEPHWIILYNVEDFSPRYKFTGPVWKMAHQEYYVRAAIRTLQALGIMPGHDVPEVHAPLGHRPAHLPLPPSGPLCPLCHSQCQYDQAYVGGRGYCWRHFCPAADCNYFDRWKD